MDCSLLSSQTRKILQDKIVNVGALLVGYTVSTRTSRVSVRMTFCEPDGAPACWACATAPHKTKRRYDDMP